MPGTDHDSSYRLVFGHPRVVEDLLRGFASSAVGDLLDMASLKQVAARHVSDGLSQSENDMIWEVRTQKGGLLYVYVMLEFQSSPDWKMPLRTAVAPQVTIRAHPERRWRAARSSLSAHRLRS